MRSHRGRFARFDSPIKDAKIIIKQNRLRAMMAKAADMDVVVFVLLLLASFAKMNLIRRLAIA